MARGRIRAAPDAPRVQQAPACPKWLGADDIAKLVEAARPKGSEPAAAADADVQGAAGDGGAEAVAADVVDESLDTAPPPWFLLRGEPKSPALRLHEELLDFMAFIRPTPEELSGRQQWVAEIEAAAQSLWPACNVSTFGSVATGLCLPSAIVDVAVTGAEGLRGTTAMKQLAERLLERGSVAALEIVQATRRPLMKLQHPGTRLWANVVVNRTDTLESTRFELENIEAFPALVPIVLFLKMFLLQRGLHEVSLGGLDSHTLFCLALSFFQRHPSARSAPLYAATSLGHLLADFLRHYGQEFRYAQDGISVRHGGSVFDRRARGWTGKDRLGQHTLCIESPTEPRVDLGSYVWKFSAIRAAFACASHAIGAALLAGSRGAAAIGGVPGSLLAPRLLRVGHPAVLLRFPPRMEAAVPQEPEELPGSKRRRLVDAVGEEAANVGGEAEAEVAAAGGDLGAEAEVGAEAEAEAEQVEEGQGAVEEAAVGEEGAEAVSGGVEAEDQGVEASAGPEEGVQAQADAYGEEVVGDNAEEEAVAADGYELPLVDGYEEVGAAAE